MWLGFYFDRITKTVEECLFLFNSYRVEGDGTDLDRQK